MFAAAAACRIDLDDGPDHARIASPDGRRRALAQQIDVDAFVDDAEEAEPRPRQSWLQGVLMPARGPLAEVAAGRRCSESNARTDAGRALPRYRLGPPVKTTSARFSSALFALSELARRHCGMRRARPCSRTRRPRDRLRISGSAIGE